MPVQISLLAGVLACVISLAVQSATLKCMMLLLLCGEIRTDCCFMLCAQMLAANDTPHELKPFSSSISELQRRVTSVACEPSQQHQPVLCRMAHESPHRAACC